MKDFWIKMQASIGDVWNNARQRTGDFFQDWLPTLKAKHGVILVTIALIVWAIFGLNEAEAAEGELYMDVGPSQVGSNFSTGTWLQINYRANKHIDLAFGYISPQKFNTCGAIRCEYKVKAQIFTGIEFVVTDPWIEKIRLGFGPYKFSHADRIGTSDFRACVSLEYQHNKRFGAKARHCSTAGSGEEIKACNTSGFCIVNDWNTGQDSWLRATLYFGK